MKDHSLFKLLASFSKEEIKDFGDFISVPYFNKRKAVKQLFEAVKKFYPDFNKLNHKTFNIEKIFSKIFPGKEYNEGTIRVLLHYLNDLAKKFITIKSFENNEYEFNLIQQSELFSRHQVTNINKVIDKSLSELSLKNILSEQFYFQKYKLEYEKMYYLSESHMGVYEKLLDNFDFQKMYFDFNIYYNLNTMRLYLNILNIEIIYNKKFGKKLFEKIISNIEIKDYNDIPVMKAYYYLIKIITSKNNEEYYFKIKEIVKEIKNKIHIDDLTEIYINMKNFCKRRIADGKEYYLNEEFKIIIDEIETKTYLKGGGEMGPVFYRNTVNSALKLKKYDWVKDFIDNFKNELPENIRNYSYLYSSALYSFKMKEYEKSLEYLSKVKFDEVYQKVEAKILQMMIFYEMNSDETLLSSLEAFRHFINGNKIIPGKRKLPYIGFYKTLNKVISIKFKKDKYQIREFKNQLLAENTISNKEWLMEKTDELLINLSSGKNMKQA